MSTPVFYVVSAALLGIYFLAQPRMDVPCEDNIGHALQRPWLHVNWSHLLANLVAFWALIEIERRMGSGAFALLLAFLFLTVVLMDLVMPSSIDKCSIGFSGVVLGLVIWDAFDRGALAFDWAAILAILWIWIGPVLQNPRISLWGHLYGILAGLIAAFITSRFLRYEPKVAAVRGAEGSTVAATDGSRSFFGLRI
jgi:membrane associated rhomboid family serine protease